MRTLSEEVRLFRKRYTSHNNPTEVMNELLRLAEIIYYPRYGKSLHKARKDWEKKKNTRKRFLNYVSCFVCGAPHQCRHHIILLKNGGSNGKRNVIPLCNSCHAEIHPWLKK